MKYDFPLVFGAALLAVLLGGCGTSASLTALSPEAPIVVDAQLGEWSEGLSGFEDDKVLVGVRQDAERTYVAVQISDQATVRQVMMMGLRVWIDADGGRDRHFGVQYPLGLLAYNRGRMGQLPLPSGQSDPAEMDRMFKETLTEMDVLVNGSAPRRISNGESPDIRVAARREYGALVYELSFPLAGADEVGLAAIEDGVFGLSIQTGALARPTPQQRERAVRGGGRGGRGTGMGGRGGGAGMRGGQRPPGARGGAPEPLDLWIQVTQAAP